ncbi:MAG: hypothetical protein ACRDDN_04515, partial [Aeromonas veronii]
AFAGGQGLFLSGDVGYGRLSGGRFHGDIPLLSLISLSNGRSTFFHVNYQYLASFVVIPVSRAQAK